MMDKTYIQEHRILELYVLGELSDSEMMQVESALLTYPELKVELSNIEESFEKLAFENAIEPSHKLKNKILESIPSPEHKVISMQPKPSNSNMLKIITGIAAACLIGLFYMYSEWNTTQKQLQLVEEQNSKLNEKLDRLVEDYNSTNAMYTAINNPNTEKYILRGNTLMPDAKLISYVNTEAQTVIVNTTYLPELDDEHDYQMWADVKGEMINMGIIDTEKAMLAMNFIENSESLNITIEPQGGSDHPTVSKLITNIYLK